MHFTVAGSRPGVVSYDRQSLEAAVGEVTRRRAARISSPPTNRQIEQAFHAIQAESGGVCTLTLVSPLDAPRLLSQASDGDRIAHVQLEAITHVFQLVERNTAAAPLCLLCGAAFRRDQLPMLFGFLQAHRDDPTQLIANAICAECCAKHATSEAISYAVTDYFRTNLMGDLRVLPQPLYEAGHA